MFFKKYEIFPEMVVVSCSYFIFIILIFLTVILRLLLLDVCNFFKFLCTMRIQLISDNPKVFWLNCPITGHYFNQLYIPFIF